MIIPQKQLIGTGYYKDAYTGLPYYKKPGEKITFWDNNTADLSISNDKNFYGGELVALKLRK